MNIFLLSEDYCPRESATMQCDDHVRKMGIETCQLISLAFSLDRLKKEDVPRTQSGNPRKHFNPKHPCGIWALKSRSNVQWLIEHADALFGEFEFRFKKEHFTKQFLNWAKNNLRDSELCDIGLTEFPIAINEQSNCRQIPDFNNKARYEQYRLFYQHDKPFAKWQKGREKPEWFGVAN